MFISREAAKPFDWNGLTIRDYTSGDELSSSVAEIDVPPGVAHAEAYSTLSDKYYVVVEGTLAFVVDGEERALWQGDFVFVPRTARFSYRNDGEARARLLLIHTPAFSADAEVLATDSG